MFQPGQTVLCVNVEEDDSQGLEVGKQYVVEVSNSTFTKVQGLMTYFYTTRFETI